MSSALDTLTIKGFKSIKSLTDFKLGSLNILIGANGSGKSNFVDFFRMLRAMSVEGLQKFVTEQGGADGFFFLGPKNTPKISAILHFGDNQYGFDFQSTASSQLMIAKEWIYYKMQKEPEIITYGALESSLYKNKDTKSRWGDWYSVPKHVYNAISSWVVYHFHDTSMLAPMRREQSIRDKIQLRSDASNIAAFLLCLRENEDSSYRLILDTIRLIAPFFDDFILEPEEKGGEKKLILEWRQKGSDYPFQPNQLSDGTIRFICLTTALMQPNPPATIVIDEPELGLHPYAISLLSNLIRSASERTQVIIATQCPALLDHVNAEDIIVINRENSASTFHRLDSKELKDWLEEYSLGELWQKNVLQGGPAHE